MTNFALLEADKLPLGPNSSIGVFDSGSGGMVTAAFVTRILADADLPASVLFFGDTANLPYGTRTQQNVADLSDAIIDRLAPTCPVIGIACNTASASWRHYGKKGKGGNGTQVFSVVDTGAELAYQRAKLVYDAELKRHVKIIGVLGTQLTAGIQSHAERIAAIYRDDVSKAIGHQLPLVPYEFGATGLAPALGPGLIDYAHTPHVAVIREDEEAPGGTTRVGARNWTPPDELAGGVMVIARDAQNLVADVDVAHVLDDNGDIKPEFRQRVHDYLREHSKILVKRRATALILGCTHFEYFIEEFGNLLPTMAARGSIVCPSGALACKLVDAFEDRRHLHPIQPIAPVTGAYFAYSGQVPPEAMFRSLHMPRATLLAAI